MAQNATGSIYDSERIKFMLQVGITHPVTVRFVHDSEMPPGIMQFLDNEGVRRLMRTLSSEEIEVLEQIYGLCAGTQLMTLSEISRRMGIIPEQFEYIEARALDKMRRKYDELTRVPQVVSPEIASMPLTLDNLSERAFHALRRNQVHTIGELVTKCEDELLGYANFGQKSLDEVKEFLYYKGLRLAG